MSIHARNIKAYNSTANDPHIITLNANHKMNEINFADIDAPGAKLVGVTHDDNFTVSEWYFNEIKCYGFGVWNFGSIDTINIPSTLELSKIDFVGPNNFSLSDTDEYLPTGDSDTTGITLRNVSQIKKLIFRNCTFKNFKNAVYIDNDTIPLVSFRNCDFLNNYRHMYFSADTIDVLDVTNNFFGNHCGVNSNNNPILRIIDGPEIINNVDFIGNTIYSDSTRWLINVDTAPTVTNLTVARNRIHTGKNTLFWHPSNGATNFLTMPDGVFFNATGDSMFFRFRVGYKSVSNDTSEGIRLH